MTTAAASTLERAVTSNRTPRLRHIYHGQCNRDQNPRTAYCGHKSGPTTGVAYSPKLPDVCNVCEELYKAPCAVCANR